MAKKKQKDKRKESIELQSLKIYKPTFQNQCLTYQGNITVKELAAVLKVHDYDIIKYFFVRGERVFVNGTLLREKVKDYCSSLNIKIKVKEPISDVEIAEVLLTPDDESSLKKRHPVVSILGHVDHGKTTLLDCIRKTNTAAKEQGRITQHIGAYIVSTKEGDITFIDTPGHEAFIQMRRRGAKAADIAVIVVAANDGVKEQTIESIKHAKEAKAAIIVAINKIDMENIDIEKIKSDLSDYGLQPEEWGGSVPYIGISAKANINIDKLLDTIITVSQVALDLKAAIDKMASGIVIESHLDPHLGPISTLLVQNGTLKQGDIVIAGQTMGKIRQMVDENYKLKNIANPSTPVRISGLSDSPHVGDLFVATKDEKKAKKLILYKKEMYLSRKRGLFKKVITESGNKKVINIIVRADTQGSLEVISSLLTKFKLKNQHINILSLHVGKITQTDVDLASSTNAAIIAFNVKAVNKSIYSKIKIKNIRLIFEQIIYRIEEQVIQLILDNADVITEKQQIGEAEIKQIFVANKIGKIAGCSLVKGKVLKSSLCMLTRQEKVIEKDIKVKSLRRFKEEVQEVNNKQEFGIALENKTDFKAGDILTFFEILEKKPKLEDLVIRGDKGNLSLK